MGNKRDGDSCYSAALEDEPMFVLLARDPKAPGLVRKWADKREKQIAKGKREMSDMSKVQEARLQANAMETWRLNNDGKWRQ